MATLPHKKLHCELDLGAVQLLWIFPKMDW